MATLVRHDTNICVYYVIKFVAYANESNVIENGRWLRPVDFNTGLIPENAEKA